MAVLSLVLGSNLSACRPIPEQTSGLQSTDGIFSKDDASGLYFVGPRDAFAKAIPGQVNPYFDPQKPTFIHIHGWYRDGARNNAFTSFSGKSFHISVENLADIWRNKGWNFGVLDWTQYSDTVKDRSRRIGLIPGDLTYDTAERAIWGRNEDHQLTYILADGQIKESNASSVTEKLTKDYLLFMRSAYPKARIRFHGHSIGAQLAITMTQAIAEEVRSHNLPPSLIPTRVALTDPIASNCAKPWLPQTKVRKRQFGQDCAGLQQGDWVGERLLDSVTWLKANHHVVFEAYRCWPVTSSGLAGDALTPLFQEMAFVEKKPWFASAVDLNTKHSACNWGYLWSIASAPPTALGSAGGALSASQEDERVRAAMQASQRFVQFAEPAGTRESQFTPDPSDDVYALEPW
jgi:hypothetical protein